MIESPLYRETVEEAERKGATEAMRRAILKVLVRRLGPDAGDLAVDLESVAFDRLEDLIDLAAECGTLDQFRARRSSG